MSLKECGVKFVCDDKSPLYDRRLCEKPISYHREKSKQRIKGKSKIEIRNEFIKLCHDLGFNPVLPDLD